MAGALIGALRVSLGLDSAQFNTGLKSAQTKAHGFASNLTASLVGAAAGFLSLNTVINGARTALDKFGDIADRSASSGLDPEFFQGIAHGASLAGVGMESLSGALDTFNRSAGLASEGKGKLVSQLQALSPELLKNIQLSTNQADRLRAVADALATETDASRQAAIATAVFGGEGAKLVAVFEGGAAAIDKMVSKAKEIGITVDRDLISRADELGDKLDTANQIVSTKLNVGFVALAPLIADAAGWAGELAKLMAIAYEQTKAISDRQFLNPLQNELAATYNAMQPLKDELADIKTTLNGTGPDGGWVLQLRADQAQAELDTLTKKANELLERIQVLQGYKPPEPAGPPVDPRDTLFSGMTGRGGDGRIKPVEPFYTPGGDKPQIAKAAEVASTALVKTTANLDDLGKKAVDVEGLTSSFGSSFVDDLLAGKSATESLIDSLDDLAKQLASQFLNQGISQLLGAVFGTGGIGGLKALPGMGGLNGSVKTLPGSVLKLEGGGYTGSGPRAGGMDGRGGFMAMLHPNETVTDHARGQGGMNVVVNNYGNDQVSTQQRPDGGIDVIIGEVSKHMASGGFDRSLGGRYGVAPRTRRT